MKKFRVLSTLLVCILMVSMLAGCGSTASSAPVASKAESTGEKIDMVVMVENPELDWTKNIVPMLEKKFPNINFISKSMTMSQIDQTVKTTFAGGEAIDIVVYWPNQMKNFTSANMALDLTPYLEADPAWRDSFTEGALEVGKHDGCYVAIPSGTVYPMLQLNMDIMKEAGVEVKEQWTWQEFLDACQKIKDNTDAYPVGVAGEHACWFVRNGLMQCWDDQAELDSFNAGKVPFTDERVKNVFEDISAIYKNNYCYPGESALTTTFEQVRAAWAQKKIGIYCNVNVQGGIVRDAAEGAFDVKIISWPRIGTPEMDFLLGGSDGYFIPSNTKHPDEAVEVLKYITSAEVMQIAADAGQVVPIKGIDSIDPDYGEYGKDAAKVYPTEPIGISPEMFDYIVYNTPANYILYGKTCLDELEALRVAGVAK